MIFTCLQVELVNIKKAGAGARDGCACGGRGGGCTIRAGNMPA